jgi:hypothetical protein
MRRPVERRCARAADFLPATRTLRLFPAIAILLVAMPCHAFPEYPAVVEATLRLSAPPACTLCHTDPNGGQGTAQQKFALTLKQFGLPNTEDIKELQAILEDVDACNVDSDGDGVPDIVEIQKGTNPNDGPAGPVSDCGNVRAVPTLQTGCAIGPKPKAPGAAFTAAAVSFAIRFRRRAGARDRRARSARSRGFRARDPRAPARRRS